MLRRGRGLALGRKLLRGRAVALERKLLLTHPADPRGTCSWRHPFAD
jgi:hypothetical protein